MYQFLTALPYRFTTARDNRKAGQFDLASEAEERAAVYFDCAADAYHKFGHFVRAAVVRRRAADAYLMLGNRERAVNVYERIAQGYDEATQKVAADQGRHTLISTGASSGNRPVFDYSLPCWERNVADAEAKGAGAWIHNSAMMQTKGRAAREQARSLRALEVSMTCKSSASAFALQRSSQALEEHDSIAISNSVQVGAFEAAPAGDVLDSPSQWSQYFAECFATATDNERESMHRDLAFVFHPDRHRGQEEKFKPIFQELESVYKPVPDQVSLVSLFDFFSRAMQTGRN